VRIITIILLFVSMSVFPQDIGGDYYVATDGNDSDPGTYAEPWLTVQKAFNTADAGDTVYFRGGTYLPTTRSLIAPQRDPAVGNSGTVANPICYFAYTGETVIFDYKNSIGFDAGWNHGIETEKAEYIHFKDLTITNVFMLDSNKVGAAMQSAFCSNMTYENITVHQIGMRGFWHEGGNYTSPAGPFEDDTTRYINCDAYNICDTFVNNPGNAGDGWKVRPYEGGVVYWEGCRAWNYSDDGFDPSGEGKRIFINCWTMASNKYSEYGIEGNGFKVAGIVDDSLSYSTGYMQECLAVYCPGNGFRIVAADATYPNFARYYNNTAFKCGSGFVSEVDDVGYGVYHRNNIAYGSTTLNAAETVANVYLPNQNSVESHNTWDFNGAEYPWFVETDTVTVTNADFITVDSASIVSLFTASRGDGNALPSFPVKLSPTSDLINAGVEIYASDSIGRAATRYETYVVDFYGSAPDIGAYQYNANDPTNPKVRYHGAGSGGKMILDSSGKMMIIRQ
jgi:hypothetical protein